MPLCSSTPLTFIVFDITMPIDNTPRPYFYSLTQFGKLAIYI